jgi:hypothetical protein
MEHIVSWYDWIYTVDDSWKIVNIKRNRELKWEIDIWWYKKVTLSMSNNAKSFFIHRLVAIAFIPNPEQKPFVNHKNWIKTDNRVDNLEWCTRSENELHKYSVLWYSWSQMWKELKTAKAVSQFNKDWTFISSFRSLHSADLATKARSQHIWKCCNGKRKTAGWFIWKFKY